MSHRNLPFTLSATVTINAGSTGVPDMGKLASPYRYPIAIDEIRFEIEPTRTASGSPQSYALFTGCAVRARLNLGRMEITNGFVPVALMGSAVDDAVELVNGTQVTGSNSWSYNFYRWVLPKPLVLNPGQALTPTLLFVNDFAAFTSAPASVTVRISYSGRILMGAKQQNGQLPVPYVTAFVPEAPIYPTISSQSDLRNPFQAPLRVQRLTGRIQWLQPAQNLSLDLMTSPLGNGNGNGQDGFQVKLRDSLGYEMVKERTDFAQVFEATFRSWTCNTILDPKQWFVAQLFTSVPSANLKPMIGLVGYRYEEIAP